MAYGRVSIVLGIQQGLGAVTHIFESARTGRLRSAAESSTPTGNRNTLTDSEIFSVLNQIAQLDQILQREELDVYWSCLGADPKSELQSLFDCLSIQKPQHHGISLEAVQSLDADFLIFVPLDIHSSRQVEQLARLSLIAPRIKHVAIATPPRWSHSQLMALKETWRWVDPKKPKGVLSFAEEIIQLNGKMGNRDLNQIGENFNAPKPSNSPQIITKSRHMIEVLEMVDAVADSDSTILVSGDSGVGKELVAQRIHDKSHRQDKPIIAVNCGAIPSELLESELFGHIKGAFTGAINNREGRFQAAQGGTLFLDEIGELSPGLQVKLLRVLQNKTFEPVGATRSMDADVRIIAATNRDLESEVREGNFREDLFYRLNVIPIHVPNLRERPEDVELLVNHFIKRFDQEKNRRVTGVTRASLRALVAYQWPGNVRELENLMERMVILKSSGMIDVLDFPEKYRRISLSEIEYDDLTRGPVGPGNGSQFENVNQQQFRQPGVMPNLLNRNQGGEVPMSINGPFINKPIYQNANDSMGQQQQQQQQQQPQQHQNHQPQQQGSYYQQPMQHPPQQGASSYDENGAGLNVADMLNIVADKFNFPVEGLDFNSVVDQFENILILMALERTGWNRNRAAQLLRLNRTTLVEKLKKKQLAPPMTVATRHLAGQA